MDPPRGGGLIARAARRTPSFRYTARMPVPRSERTYLVCRKMLSEGRFPSPTALNDELGHGPHNNNLNGRDCQARTEALTEAGYTKDGSGPQSRWSRP